MDDNTTAIIIFGMCIGTILLISLGLSISASGAGFLVPLGIGIVIGVVATKLWDRHKNGKQM